MPWHGRYHCNSYTPQIIAAGIGFASQKSHCACFKFSTGVNTDPASNSADTCSSNVNTGQAGKPAPEGLPVAAKLVQYLHEASRVSECFAKQIVAIIVD